MGWKIVRDNQREFCEREGVSGSWRTSEHPVDGLTKKLFEEAGEFAEHHDPGELYDVRDVVDELLRLLDPDYSCETRHFDKTLRLGLFDSHLEWTPVPGK